MASGFTDKLSVRIKKEIIKIRNLKGIKAKAAYIWDYYRVPILGTIAVMAMAISLITSIRANNYNTSLYVSYVNCVSMDLKDDTGILKRRLTEWLGIDGKENRVEIDGYYQVDPNVFSEDTYVSTEKLSMLVFSSTSDCYLGDDVFTQTWASSGYLYDLTEALPPELLKKVSDRLVYYTDGERGEEKALGIDLDGLPFIDEVLVFGSKKPIFSIVVNAPNLDNCITFLEHIIDYE